MRSFVALGVSVLALAVSAGSFLISYLNFRNTTLQPSVYTRLNELIIDEDPLRMSATLDFSISNLSSQPISIARCEFSSPTYMADGLPEEFKDCGIKEISRERGLDILAGRTAFFSTSYARMFDDERPELELEQMGMNLKDITLPLASGPCKASFGSSRGSYGMVQNCALVHLKEDAPAYANNGQIAFYLTLQTGSGLTIKNPVYLTSDQQWPWGK